MEREENQLSSDIDNIRFYSKQNSLELNGCSDNNELIEGTNFSENDTSSLIQNQSQDNVYLQMRNVDDKYDHNFKKLYESQFSNDIQDQEDEGRNNQTFEQKTLQQYVQKSNRSNINNHFQMSDNKAIQRLKNSEKSVSVDLTFKNLKYSVTIKGKQRVILNNLNGSFKAGTVTAILSDSEGGKTSLLNVLSQKIKSKKGIDVTGKIKANGKAFSNEEFNQFSAYVMQKDYLLETLTSKECIQYAADFKLSGSEEYKKSKNSLIREHFLKGISRGERKRVNIGCELITDPSVLFLDEPTSGLDSFAAYIVISVLKDFAKQFNKTVIMSIHSPNTDIWNLFDKIILLVQGKMIYQGPQADIIPYFKSIGFECPMNMCPGDYLMNHMTWNEKNETIFPHFYEQYDQRIEPLVFQSIGGVQELDIPLKDVVTTQWYQIKKIAIRTITQTKRNPLLFKSRVSQSIIFSLFLGYVFLNQNKLNKNSPYTDIQNKLGLLFISGISMFMKSFDGMRLTFPAERDVFLKEENSKYYSTFAYLIGRLTPEFLQITLYPIITTIFVYFMADLNQNNAELFFYYLLVLISLSYIGNAFGLVCGTIFTNPNTAALFYIPFILFTGFFKNRNDYTDWIGWLQYLSPFTYALEGLVTNEIEFTETPFDIKQHYDYNIGKWNCFYILIGLFAFYQILAVIALYSKRGSLQ